MGHSKPDNADLSKRALFFGKKTESVIEDDGPKIASLGENCLAYQSISCRLCEDACEIEAISFRPQLGGKEFPIINNDTCTGCGECLPVCPSSALTLMSSPTRDTNYEV